MLVQLLMPTTNNKQAPDFMQEKVSIEMLKYRNKQNDHSLSNHKERHREKSTRSKHSLNQHKKRRKKIKTHQSPVLGCLLIEGTSRVGAKCIPL